MNPLKCEECGKDARGILSAWDDWKYLANLLQFLRNEESITDATYSDAFNALLRFKSFASDSDEKAEATNS